MKIGIIGSGMVGQTIGKKLVELGHEVVLGTRDPQQISEKKGWAGSLKEWLDSLPKPAKIATFAEAAAYGELVINATGGVNSLAALQLAGADNLSGKVLIDIANELDFSKGMPPQSLATDTISLGEKIQAAFPTAKVVKTLNTMNAFVMVAPESIAAGNHTVFVSGNNSDAKSIVTSLLQSFGWQDIIDLGDIQSARGTEMLMPIWLKLMQQLGTGSFNYKIVR
jgi:8-hydroxy-5-deazaflavin:NADPH oxidoreductase